VYEGLNENGNQKESIPYCLPQ